MPNLIDRRLNPKDKNLGNRQRFLKRARAQIKKVVDNSIDKSKVSDAGVDGEISIPSKGIGEPRFRHAGSGGNRQRVLPGNKEFVTGDQIAKPRGGSGSGGSGKEASESGEGEDEFVFTLTREEFLEFFFEDLELPDLIKTSLKETHAVKPHRAGFATSGAANNVNIRRTMVNSIGRRRALRRPRRGQIEELKKELATFEGRPEDELRAEELKRLAQLHIDLRELERRQRAIPFIDPFDVRYNRFEQRPEPRTKAVMFCLMDVSGSMGEREKDLAKRFFILLHLFLQRRYERVELVFIRHTHKADEVDEHTFFHSTETGGTAVSTALQTMHEVVADRYPAADWNIYAAQASDGDNFMGDTARCQELLLKHLLPVCQYYAYVEILDEREYAMFENSNDSKELWRGYLEIDKEWPNFSMKHISKRSDIYPVFRELFAKQGMQA
ncbi:MAG: YeaH/YhbH family protein [Proteobacteria bacterium]|nr:YeaH/YhbH family protein [Pseudomonadota bacterium]MDA1324348.1 YeaH/YhbH family protein [Pseudomonadota bacterium]